MLCIFADAAIQIVIAIVGMYFYTDASPGSVLVSQTVLKTEIKKKGINALVFEIGQPSRLYYIK